MRSVDISEAAAAFDRLVREASEGHGFIIMRAGRPLAKVVPVEDGDATPAVRETAEDVARRRIGFMAGEFDIPEDFDSMFAVEIEEMFYGGGGSRIMPRT